MYFVQVSRYSQLLLVDPIVIVLQFDYSHKKKFKVKDSNTLELSIVMIVIVSSSILPNSKICSCADKFMRVKTLTFQLVSVIKMCKSWYTIQMFLFILIKIEVYKNKHKLRQQHEYFCSFLLSFFQKTLYKLVLKQAQFSNLFKYLFIEMFIYFLGKL